MALRAAAHVIYEPISALMLHVQIVFADVNLPSFRVLLTLRPLHQTDVIYVFSLCFPYSLSPPDTRKSHPDSQTLYTPAEAEYFAV